MHRALSRTTLRQTARSAADGPFARVGPAAPDGICLDAKGAVWAASPPTREVFRVHEGGQITARFSTAPLRAYACMLGGEDRCTLFVCMASTSHPADAAFDRTGCIGTIRVDVPGAGRP
jgi:sugar lactone lactonase YvrE